MLQSSLISPSIALPSIGQLEASICRDDLKSFIYKVWPIVEPSEPISWNWHHDVLCDLLTSITLRRRDRQLNGITPTNRPKIYVINVPPGTSKSLLVNVFWPTWEWLSEPYLRYLMASFTPDNTIRDNLKARSIIQSDWCQTYFPKLKLSSDQYAKVRFDTTAKGWRFATSVGGAGLGEHPHRILMDDPLKQSEAKSDTSRKSCIDWTRGTISTRKALDPDILLIMQRLHMNDPSGYYLSLDSPDVEHVCFPMRYRPTQPDPDSPGKYLWKADPRDPRTIPGELLWPDKFPEEKVRMMEIELGPSDAAGWLGQDPVPEGGGLFKREYFPTVEALPVKSQLIYCRGWDKAGTENGGDWSAGILMAIDRKEKMIYVVDVVRERTENIDQLIPIVANADGKGVAVREEQEPGASGKTVIKARAKLLQGYDYAGVSASGDKVTKSRPWRAQCQAGNVKLLRGSWNRAFIDEHVSFPVGMWDDQVDGAAVAYNELSERVGKAKGLLWG